MGESINLVEFEINPVPIPSVLWLLGSGISGLKLSLIKKTNEEQQFIDLFSHYGIMKYQAHCISS